MDENPFEEIEGVGKRKKGKTQLTIDEARVLLATCLAADGIGATAALCCLLLAMRAGEIVGLSPRSIDDGGRILRIDVAKTDAGIRLIEIPEVLRDRLPALAAASFDRHWGNRNVHRLCKKAGVTNVGPHALRGTHASLATQAASVTHRHYTKPSLSVSPAACARKALHISSNNSRRPSTAPGSALRASKASKSALGEFRSATALSARYWRCGL